MGYSPCFLYNSKDCSMCCWIGCIGNKYARLSREIPSILQISRPQTGQSLFSLSKFSPLDHFLFPPDRGLKYAFPHMWYPEDQLYC